MQAFDIRSMKYQSTACLCWYFSGSAGIFVCVLSFSSPLRADSPSSKRHFSSWLYGYSHAAAEMNYNLNRFELHSAVLALVSVYTGQTGFQF